MLRFRIGGRITKIVVLVVLCALIGGAVFLTANKNMALSKDWFKDAGYGVFVHWTTQSVNEDGTSVPYYTAVKNFDVNRFANQVDETGAKFVIFTISHAEHFLAFPCPTMDKICPGHTTNERDLYADMYDALHAKGIQMMFYWNCAAYPGTKNDGDYYNGSEWATNSAHFAQHQYDLVEAIGKRYGDKLAGWWVDTCYDDYQGMPVGSIGLGKKFDFAKYASKLRTGNPNRLVSFNFRWRFWGSDTGKGIEDYQAGEDGMTNNLYPSSRYSGEGGTQWFACDAQDPTNSWVYKAKNYDYTRFQDDQVVDYITNVIKQDGVYAYNVALYQDGRIAKSTMEQLKKVKKAIRDENKAAK